MRIDTLIVGLGAMGSAAAYQLSLRGGSVVGIDRFHPPHALGSSHGGTRIIREAYFEHPAYVPMVQRAYTLWDDLAQRSGRQLYLRTGGLMIGAPDSELVEGALKSANQHRLEHDVLDAARIRARFPALQAPDGFVGVLEPRAGILFPERCIAAHLALARDAGAVLRFDERVCELAPRAGGVEVVTDAGRHFAERVIVTAGPWLPELLPHLALPLTVERQTLYWFDAQGAGDRFDPARCPVHLWQFDGRHFFYGFPDLGDGVKLGRHHDGVLTTADAVDREVSAAEIDDVRALARRFVPVAADGPLRDTAVCLYTNTPDEHFWIDAHPVHPQVLIVSPCSGHGFKFASVIGEIAADWATAAAPRFDLSLFRARDAAAR
jgi:sarcosine oxidase